MSRFGLGMRGAPGGNDQFTKILLHMEGANAGTTFTDDNANALAHTWTAASTTTSTTQAKFGATSLSDAAGGKVSTPTSADFTLGSSDFAVDFWFWVSGGAGAARVVCGQIDSGATNASGSVEIGLLASNVMTFDVFQGSAFVAVTGTTAFTTTGWHHCACTRNGGFLRMFLDGVQEGGNVAITGAINTSTNKFSVGGVGDYLGVYWNGFIDEFRLSIGTPRWTANFTPPIAPYSA